MNGREFLDTNVLIYAHDTRDPRKRARARELIRRLIRERRGVLSLQVLRAALNGACTTLNTEDMQSGYVVDSLTLRNPFQSRS